MTETTDTETDDMRSDYGADFFRDGVRGKHYEEYQRYMRAKNNAQLEPDIRAAFPTDEAVNAALRSLIQNGSVKVATESKMRDAEPALQ